MANQQVFGPPSFGASGGSSWNFLGQFGDEEFRKALGEAWSGAGAGYQAADTPFDFTGGGQGRAMARPEALQMQTSGSLFGGYNPYLDRRPK